MDAWLETKQLPVHLISAAGLVKRDNKVILIRSERRGWELPGGIVEQGETLTEGLIREISEESGITAEPTALAGVYQNLSQKKGYGPLEGTFLPPVLIFDFVCRYVSGEPAITEETLEAGWFTPEEAVELVTEPSFTERLSRLLEFDGTTGLSVFRKPAEGEFGDFRRLLP